MHQASLSFPVFHCYHCSPLVLTLIIEEVCILCSFFHAQFHWAVTSVCVGKLALRPGAALTPVSQQSSSLIQFAFIECYWSFLPPVQLHPVKSSAQMFVVIRVALCCVTASNYVRPMGPFPENVHVEPAELLWAPAARLHPCVDNSEILQNATNKITKLIIIPEYVSLSSVQLTFFQ